MMIKEAAFQMEESEEDLEEGEKMLDGKRFE